MLTVFCFGKPESGWLLYTDRSVVDVMVKQTKYG